MYREKEKHINMLQKQIIDLDGSDDSDIYQDPIELDFNDE